MKNSLSLRVRLTFVILAPLLVIAALVGAWAYSDAEARAAERFDRSLLSTALAISRDTIVSGGDLLSEDTRDLLRDTSGGAVFYHVYAPDGVFVTGYATPPVAPGQFDPNVPQTYFDAIYQGAPVRAIRFSQSTTMDGLTGLFTFTVWQNISVRDGFVETRVWPVFLIIASMIGALAVIVWFGVRLGLRPLIDLEEAIAQRSASDLTPIKRSIPQEVEGIVGQFNVLIDELSRTLEAKNAFISNAAHQLRNPIAGVLALAESVQSAKTLDAVAGRADDLVDAARETGKLANDLLTLDRVQTAATQLDVVVFDPTSVLHPLAARFSASAEEAGIAFDAEVEGAETALQGDPVMFEQAVLNLLNNALNHGGPDLRRIQLRARTQGETFEVSVIDDGKGIHPDDFERALGRFSQVGPSAGSGLGLPIAKAVIEAFGGQILFDQAPNEFAVRLSVPEA